MHTVESATEYLTSRAAIYDGSFQDILFETPTILWDSPDELVAFWEGRDISHVFPKSIYPEVASDWNNMMPEEPFTNRARGAVTIDANEIATASADNEAYAEVIDSMYDTDSIEVLCEVIAIAV